MQHKRFVFPLLIARVAATTAVAGVSASRSNDPSPAEQRTTVAQRSDLIGVPDPTFGSNGVVTIAGVRDQTSRAIGVDADGRIVVAGTNTLASGRRVLEVRRFDSNGAPEATYGKQGIARVAFASDSVEVDRLEVLPSGGALVVGTIATSAGSQAAIARLSSAGVLDNTFGSKATPGRTVVSMEAAAKTAAAGLIVDADGSSFVGVSADARVGILKLDPSGRPDPQFGPEGAQLVDAVQGRLTTGTVVRVADLVMTSPTKGETGSQPLFVVGGTVSWNGGNQEAGFSWHFTTDTGNPTLSFQAAASALTRVSDLLPTNGGTVAAVGTASCLTGSASNGEGALFRGTAPTVEQWYVDTTANYPQISVRIDRSFGFNGTAQPCSRGTAGMNGSVRHEGTRALRLSDGSILIGGGSRFLGETTDRKSYATLTRISRKGTLDTMSLTRSPSRDPKPARTGAVGRTIAEAQANPSDPIHLTAPMTSVRDMVQLSGGKILLAVDGFGPNGDQNVTIVRIR